MLELIIVGSILSLLLYACWTDIKELYVSNRVTYSIAILALLMFNPVLLSIKILLSLFLIASWKLKMIGGADVKVLIPIVFMLGVLPFVAFLIILCTTGVLMGMAMKTKEYAGFVPITMAFIIAGVIPII